MNIAIFDPSGNHGHYAQTLGLVFENDNIEWFIHESVAKRLTDTGVLTAGANVHPYFSGKVKTGYYLKSIRQLKQKKWDIIFFNTLQSDWLPNFFFFLLIKKSMNVVLTIHNIHSFFAREKKKSLRTAIKQTTKRLALKKCKLNVFGENLKRHLLTFAPNSTVLLMPYQVYTQVKQPGKANYRENLKVVIPGSVDLKRRDYPMSLEIMKALSGLKNIKFVLLGTPIGAESKAFIAAFEKMTDTVTCYPTFVNEIEFEKQISSADLIWGPLYKYYRGEEEEEEYGVTKETGITFAIIRYALPGIFPAELTIMDEIKSGVRTYENPQELIQLLKELSTNKQNLISLKENALVNSKRFEPHIIKKQFMEQLSNNR